MKTLGNFKRGDSFAFYANLKDTVTGDAIDLPVENIRCQVRNASNKLYSTLSIHKDEIVAGKYLFYATREVTQTWPASITGVLLYIDVEIIMNDVTTSTETFTVNILQDVTKVV